jgi:hypothetical protein
MFPLKEINMVDGFGGFGVVMTPTCTDCGHFGAFDQKRELKHLEHTQHTQTSTNNNRNLTTSFLPSFLHPATFVLYCFGARQTSYVHRQKPPCFLRFSRCNASYNHRIPIQTSQNKTEPILYLSIPMFVPSSTPFSLLLHHHLGSEDRASA